MTNPDGFGTCCRYETGWKNGFMRPGFMTATTRWEGLWSVAFETFMRDKTDPLTDEPFGSKYAAPYYVEPKSSPVDNSWHESQIGNENNPNADKYADYTVENYPYILSTGRRIPVYFHNEHRQLPWCREVWPVPRLEVHPDDAAQLGLEQGDWAWIETPFGNPCPCDDDGTPIIHSADDERLKEWRPSTS